MPPRCKVTTRTGLPPIALFRTTTELLSELSNRTEKLRFLAASEASMLSHACATPNLSSEQTDLGMNTDYHIDRSRNPTSPCQSRTVWPELNRRRRWSHRMGPVREMHFWWIVSLPLGWSSPLFRQLLHLCRINWSTTNWERLPRGKDLSKCMRVLSLCIKALNF